ncbi:hypothetical protein GSI_10444 [Ganoderma sinense ZZ0214-1]|uniref:Uncharacterized protein n=1 Tax=Ganoderma sinense ZZ0214-1 TaxID=1077348 RepID=A0A2G8S0N0_9APHY|nr:hypothetical protein GSI_10444 [Ganoderma sinense ZZ0214-1]
MSVMAATTSHSAPYIHRSYPLATSTGDASYSPAMFERVRRPDTYSRHLPPLSHTRTSEYTSTSHGRTRSYVYERAGAPPYPESSSESPSPREARSSLPQTAASTMQSTSISFATTISATSTWAMSPSAYSSAPTSTSSSSPVSLSRTRTQPHRAIESEQGGAASRKDRDPYPLEASHRRAFPDPLPLPSRPAPQAHAVHGHGPVYAHTYHPRASSISPDLSRGASPAAAPFTAEQRHAYRDRDSERIRERQDSWSPESARQPLPLPPMWDPKPSRGTSPEFVQGCSSYARARGRWAPPPPPSPSPSTSSYSASGRTDTDPTDEDDLQPQPQPQDHVKVEPDQEQGHEGVTLPSFRSAFPSAPPMWHSHSQPSPSHPRTPFSWDTGASPALLRRDAMSPLSSRSAAGSPAPSSAEYASAGSTVAAAWGPRSAVFRHDGAGDDALPGLVSDVRSNLNISHARSERPATTVNANTTHAKANASARQQTQWRVHQGPPRLARALRRWRTSRLSGRRLLSCR